MALPEEKHFRSAFGAAVRAAREAAELTQRQLAERADIADKYLSRVEVGEATPSVHIAARLAAALGIGLDVLVPGGVEHAPAVAAFAALLQGRSADDADRALRVARESLK